jgi:hypothetical protein
VTPLFLRCDALRDHVIQDADPGPSMKAMLLIAILSAGRSRIGLEAVYHQALSGHLAPDVRQALERAWQSGVIEAPASNVLAPSKQPASTERQEEPEVDLWSIGMEV